MIIIEAAKAARGQFYVGMWAASAIGVVGGTIDRLTVAHSLLAISLEAGMAGLSSVGIVLSQVRPPRNQVASRLPPRPEPR